MKKYILSLMALLATMSIDAQVIKVYKNNGTEPVATYTNTTTDKYKVVFEEGSDQNLLTGVFSVSSTKKVRFTKGNLQATYNSASGSYTWGLAANQHDYIGNAAGNTTIDKQTDGAVVDLFGWSGSDTSHYGLISSKEDSNYSGSTLNDWGELFPGKGYYTLSKAEWDYLLNTSGYGNTGRLKTRFAKAMVNDIKGLLIFPDNYTGTTSGDGISSTNMTSGYFPIKSIPTETWETMEADGVVFLPVAYCRQGPYVSTYEQGQYWTSTPLYGSTAYGLSFSSGSISTNTSNIYRYYGNSVRFVTVVSE